jgi:SAM-dependent methyltransferase
LHLVAAESSGTGRQSWDGRGRVCPACRAALASEEGGWACTGCGRSYPFVAGLPDLRLAPDRYLDLDDERAKACRLARLEAGRDVIGMAEAYYAMTPDVDAGRRARFLAHIAAAERRGEALAALLPREGRILEVGCGTGGLLAAALRSGRVIEGADIALRWLVVARRRLADRGLSAPLVAAGAERLPWPDATFDAVVADSVLEHLDDPSAALREWLRIARPGGRLLAWSPNRYSLLTDPHVGLWGVGWLPRRWAAAYVRRRRGPIWPVPCLSAGEARRRAIAAGWGRVHIGAATVPVGLARSAAARCAIRLHEAARRAPIGRAFVRSCGPLWQLEAVREGAA